MPLDPSQGERGQLPPIEALSAQELRTEVIDGINTTLGNLPFGPVVDGSGSFGYERDKEGLFGLQSSYVRFTKIYQQGEQAGVQLELLGLSSAQFDRIYLYQLREETMDRDGVPEEERQGARERRQQLQNMFAKDGIAPLDNRYYFIPTDLEKPARVSAESFITRADRANPEDVKKAFLPELIESEKRAQEADVDDISGEPMKKDANMQDLRDAAKIVRNYKGFVAEAIRTMPHQYWGRRGLTH